jgi:hypothetical protein
MLICNIYICTRPDVPDQSRLTLSRRICSLLILTNLHRLLMLHIGLFTVAPRVILKIKLNKKKVNPYRKIYRPPTNNTVGFYLVEDERQSKHEGKSINDYGLFQNSVHDG